MSQEVVSPCVVLYRAINENRELNATAVGRILKAVNLGNSQTRELARRVINFIGIEYAPLFSEDIQDPRFASDFCQTALRCLKVQKALMQGKEFAEVDTLDEMESFKKTHSFHTEEPTGLVKKELKLIISILPFPYLQSSMLSTSVKLKVALGSLRQREAEFLEAIQALYVFFENPEAVLLEETLASIVKCTCRHALLVREGKPIYAPTLLDEWMHVNKSEIKRVRQIFNGLPFTFPPREAHLTLIRSHHTPSSFQIYVVRETLICLESVLRVAIPEPFREKLHNQMMEDDDLRIDISNFVGFIGHLLGKKVNRSKPSYPWLIRFQYYFAFLREYLVPDEKRILERFLFWLLSAKLDHFELNLKISPNPEALYETADVLRLEHGKIVDMLALFEMVESLRPILLKNQENLEDHAIVFFTIFCRIIYSGITGETPQDEIKEMQRLNRFLNRLNRFPLMIISAGQIMTCYEAHLFEKSAQYADSLVVDPQEVAGSSISLVKEGSSASLDAIADLSFSRTVTNFNIISQQMRLSMSAEEFSRPILAHAQERKEAEIGYEEFEDVELVSPRNITPLQFGPPAYRFFDMIQRKYCSEGIFSSRVINFFRRVSEIAQEEVIQLEGFLHAMQNFLDGKYPEKTFDLIAFYLEKTKAEVSVNEVLRFLSQELPRLPADIPEDYSFYCVEQALHLTRRYKFEIFDQLNLFFAFISVGQSQTQLRIRFVDELENFYGFLLPTQRVRDVICHNWNINEMANLLKLMTNGFKRPLVDVVGQFLLPQSIYDVLAEFNRQVEILKAPLIVETFQYRNLEWVEGLILNTCFLPVAAWTRSFPIGVVDERNFKYQNHGDENSFSLLDREPPYRKAVRGTWDMGRMSQFFNLSVLRLLPNVYCFSCRAELCVTLEEIEKRPHFFALLKTLAEVVCNDSIRPKAFVEKDHKQVDVSSIEIDSIKDLAEVYPQLADFAGNPELHELDGPVLNFLRQIKTQVRNCWWNIISEAQLEFHHGRVLSPLHLVSKGNVYPVDSVPSISSVPFSHSTEYSLLPLHFRPTMLQKYLYTTMGVSEEMITDILYAIRGGGERKIGNVPFTFSETFQKVMYFPLRIFTKFIGTKYVEVIFSCGREGFFVNYTVKFPAAFLSENVESYARVLQDSPSNRAMGSFQEILEAREKEEEEADPHQQEVVLHPKTEPHPAKNLIMWQLLMLRSRFYQHYCPIRVLAHPKQFNFIRSALKARVKHEITRNIPPVVEILDAEGVFPTLNEDFSRSSEGQTFTVEGHKYTVQGCEGQSFPIQDRIYTIREGKLIADEVEGGRAISPISRSAEDLTFVVEPGELVLNGTHGRDADALYELLIQQKVLQNLDSESASVSSIEFGRESKALMVMDHFHQGLFAGIQLEIVQTLDCADLPAIGFALESYKDINPYTTWNMIISEGEITIKGVHHYVLRYKGEDRYLQRRDDYGVYIADIEVKVFAQTITSSWTVM